MRIGLVTCLEPPEPDPDEELLASALRGQGHAASVVAWDDPKVAWSSFDLCVLRSTWNYYKRVDDFLVWARLVDDETALANPPAVVRWNAHKEYLADLERHGAPVVPSVWLRRGAKDTLASISEARGWDDVVVKPSVSAGSFETLRVRKGDRARGEAHLERLLATRDAMVQLYLPSVEDHGERALVWIDGELTHSVRKAPRFREDAESVSEALPISGEERAFARRVLSCLPVRERLLYARVDVAHDGEGLCVMELELIEPSLFLRQHPPALERLCRAIERWQR
jgi:glutathione synthase/RimK-type ligase-like ATP-grasp enzyme